MEFENKLSNFELDVMNLFWQLGKASAPQIHKEILQIKSVSYSTVKTIIDRLEQKKAIYRTEQEGRTIFYSAAVHKETLSKPLVKGFLNRLFNGKSTSMIAHLLENEEMTQEDIEALQQMLNEKKKRT